MNNKKYFHFKCLKGKTTKIKDKISFVFSFIIMNLVIFQIMVMMGLSIIDLPKFHQTNIVYLLIIFLISLGFYVSSAYIYIIAIFYNKYKYINIGFGLGLLDGF